MKVSVSLSTALLAALIPGAAAAQPVFVAGEALINPAIAGNTDYDGWVGLTAGNYPGFGGFPGTSAWPSGIGSNRALDNSFNASESGDAELVKVSNGAAGGPYLASGSIYFGGFSSELNYDGGTLAVQDSTPVSDLQNVIFQIQIGEAWGYDLHNRELPVLEFNSGAQALSATNSLLIDQFYNGTVEMPTGDEDVFINTYLVQWDLSGIAEPITSLSVSFTGVQHAQLYALRLDQSDVYTPVPTPGALALVGLGGAVSLRRRR